MKLRNISILLVLMLILQGCAPKSTNKAADLSDKTLTVVSPFGEGDGYMAVYQNLIAEFQTETNCSVFDTSERSSEQWKLDVLDMFGNGEEPDVLFFFTGVTVSDLITQAKLTDLNTIQQYDPDYAININSMVLSTMTEKDGLNYCVPVTGFWEGLYINLDLFNEHNITPPETMEDFITACEKFKDADIIPVAANLQNTPHYWFEYLLYSYTGPLEHESSIDDEKLKTSMTQALQTLTDLYDLGIFPPNTVTDTECTALFETKKAAMMLDGSWAAGSLTDKENVAVIHMPAPKDSARQATDIISGFSMGYYITQKGWENNRDAAVAFVKAMTSDNALALFNAGGSASPGTAVKSEAETPYLQSVSEFINSATAFTPALQDSFKKEARDYLFSEILNVLKDKVSVDSVIDEFFQLNKME